MSNNDNPAAKAPATAPNNTDSYGTPMGVFQGKPQIVYPNTPGFTPKEYVPVGGVILADTPIEYNTGRRTVTLKVRNTGDRPIQVGSHYHFFEVNRYLEFDRPKAYGYHLNIPATTAIRFEPGDEKEVELVTYWGKRRVIGFNNLGRRLHRRGGLPDLLSQVSACARPDERISVQVISRRERRSAVHIR